MNPGNPSACNPMGHAVGSFSTSVKVPYVSILLQLQSAFTLDTKLCSYYSAVSTLDLNTLLKSVGQDMGQVVLSHR